MFLQGSACSRASLLVLAPEFYRHCFLLVVLLSTPGRGSQPDTSFALAQVWLFYLRATWGTSSGLTTGSPTYQMACHWTWRCWERCSLMKRIEVMIAGDRHFRPPLIGPQRTSLSIPVSVALGHRAGCLPTPSLCTRETQKSLFAAPEQQYMTIRIAHHETCTKAEIQRSEPHRVGGGQPSSGGRNPLLHLRKLTRRHPHVPVPNIVGGGVKEQPRARCRRQVLQQFDAGPRSGGQAGNAKPCSEHIV
jgi:hypothetical protein